MRVVNGMCGVWLDCSARGEQDTGVRELTCSGYGGAGLRVGVRTGGRGGCVNGTGVCGPRPWLGTDNDADRDRSLAGIRPTNMDTGR